MVDMANAIDFRLGHCHGEFHALRSKNEKSKNGIFLPTWKLFNFNGFQVHVHGKLKKKSPDRYKIIKLFNFRWCQSKGLKQVKSHRNNSW